MKLTWSAFAYRSLWELDRRSGFKALRTPRGRVPIPASVPRFESWWSELGDAHRLTWIATTTPSICRTSRAEVAPDEMPDWHLEPSTGEHWPARVHWTEAIDGTAGDLRLTWEANRFTHVWDWIAEDDVGAAGRFERQLLDWRRANPFRSGVNWASGQELAVRSLAWLGGAAAYGRELSPSVWHDLVELLYWHAIHIESEFGFARHAVRNNHVIAEALGLAAIADAFPGFEESARWRARGLAAVEAAVEEQFFEDGGYCQCSHAYHHFVLELLVEAWDWFEELHPALRPHLQRSIAYFEAIVEPGGGVPNFGPNDRVRDSDFPALLVALRARVGVRGASVLRSSSSFPQSGLHLLRDHGTTVTLRCGELPDRAGHDDGLHVEVWCNDGVPVAIDAGSFRYSGPEHLWFAGGRSHNVCQVGSSEPRQRLGRFTWDRTGTPKLFEFDARRGLIVARYDTAYDGVTWERQIILSDGVVEVEDLLNAISPARPRVLRLHWLLNDEPEHVRVARDGECFTWNIETSGAKIVVRAEALIGTLDRPDLSVSAASAARTYGRRDLVTSVLLSVAATAVRFHTRFEPIRSPLE